LDNVLEQFQDSIKVNEISELEPNQFSVRLSQQSLSENQKLHQDANANNQKESLNVPTEQTVTLEAVVMQFRGAYSIKENSYYLESLETVKHCLQQGKVVNLIVNFVGIKKGNTSVARQLLSHILDPFQDFIEIDEISELESNQFNVRLRATSVITER